MSVIENVSCPCCEAATTAFFVEVESGTSGHRCSQCGCRFIVIKMGSVPDTGDEADHAKDCWPN